MTDLALYQPDTRGKLPAILIAASVLATVAALLFHFSPHDTAALTLSETSVVPTRTVFKSDSIVVGDAPAGQDDLYLLTTLRIEDHLRVPMTIDTMSATLVDAEDHQLTASAIAVNDAPAVFHAFPQLRPLASPLLLRETSINPGRSATGQLLFHFPINKAAWDHRKSATISVALYNQPPQTIAVP